MKEIEEFNKFAHQLADKICEESESYNEAYQKAKEFIHENAWAADLKALIEWRAENEKPTVRAADLILD
jgi:flagellar biosynthesis protein FliP